MEKIASFKVDHLKLEPGLYVSRIDYVNEYQITTYDMRITKPNVDEVMNTGSVHCYEHLGATFLRNHPIYKDKIIYFGPMGCRTGFYLIISLPLSSEEVFPLVKEMNDFVISFLGDIPGATPKDCGNYSDMDLENAKKFALKYKKEFLDKPKKSQFVYDL